MQIQVYLLERLKKINIKNNIQMIIIYIMEILMKNRRKTDDNAFLNLSSFDRYNIGIIFMILI